MTDSDLLELWTVTRRPIDLPGVEFAARQALIGPGGITRITERLVIAPTLEALRDQLPPGLVRMDRHPDDDPVIVEIWI